MQSFDCNAAVELRLGLGLGHVDEPQDDVAADGGFEAGVAMKVQPGGTDAGVRRRAERGACRSRLSDFLELMMECMFRDHSDSYLLEDLILLLDIHILGKCMELKLHAGGDRFGRDGGGISSISLLSELICERRNEISVKRKGILREGKAMYRRVNRERKPQRRSNSQS